MHTRDDVDPPLATAHRTPAAAAPAAVERTADAAGTDARAMLELQRMAGNASVSRLVAREPATDTEDEPGARSPVLDVVGRGGGEPLAPEVRAEMEGRLGADFGSVRVHRDAAASESAKAVEAHAYTVGNDVVFRSDRWDPASPAGKRTLAHELSHVVQQATGPVDGSPAPGGIRVSSPDDAFEQAADRRADAALSGPAPAAGPAAMSAGSTAQLEAAPGPEDEVDEEDMSAGTIQREGNRDAPNRPNRPGEEEEEEPEEEEEGQPSRSAQREAAPQDELDEDEALKPE